MKLYVYLPKLILNQLIEKEKLMLLRHVIQPQNKATIDLQKMNSIVDKIIDQSYNTRNYREYLDFFNYLEKYLKILYPMENLRDLRKKII